MNPVKVMNNAKVMFVRPYLNLNEKLTDIERRVECEQWTCSIDLSLVQYEVKYDVLNVKQEMAEDDSKEDMF